MNFEIREERPADEAAIRAVNDEAFAQTLEGRIIDALRANGAVSLSLVAVQDDRIIGHILYSPASIDGEVDGAGLGPMAVLPSAQRLGVGSRLIEAGNHRLDASGCPFIIVLGHPEYYPRFGFRPAGTLGIRCEWDVPDEAFMIRVLDEQRMHGVKGLAKYRDEISTVSSIRSTS